PDGGLDLRVAAAESDLSHRPVQCAHGVPELRLAPACGRLRGRAAQLAASLSSIPAPRATPAAPIAPGGPALLRPMRAAVMGTVPTVTLTRTVPLRVPPASEAFLARLFPAALLAVFSHVVVGSHVYLLFVDTHTIYR